MQFLVKLHNRMDVIKVSRYAARASIVVVYSFEIYWNRRVD